MKTKQIPNPKKMFKLVEDRHKKRGFLIRSMHGSIQNQKEAKPPNSHKVTFFNQNSSSYISFSCSIYMSWLHDDFDSKTLRKWKEMQPLITIMFWWLINADKRLQNDSLKLVADQCMRRLHIHLHIDLWRLIISGRYNSTNTTFNSSAHTL